MTTKRVPPPVKNKPTPPKKPKPPKPTMKPKPAVPQKPSALALVRQGRKHYPSKTWKCLDRLVSANTEVDFVNVTPQQSEFDIPTVIIDEAAGDIIEESMINEDESTDVKPTSSTPSPKFERRKPAPNRKPTLLKEKYSEIKNRVLAAKAAGENNSTITSAAMRLRIGSDMGRYSRLRKESEGQSSAAASARFKLKAMKARIQTRDESSEVRLMLSAPKSL
eukprot:m.179514 g.179514  ORF g.179514 m.179514 type:complete len:221 (-) comp31978_c5_seq1:81-743(-)